VHALAKVIRAKFRNGLCQRFARGDLGLHAVVPALLRSLRQKDWGADCRSFGEPHSRLA
jgi:hypothetical protein